MRNALIIDINKCIGCFSCAIACKVENDIALGEYWNTVHYEPAWFDENLGKKAQYWLPVQCQQCENASCVHVCPTGASYRDPETGIVLVDKSKCIGCKYCMMACPYGVRSWNKEEGVVEKCTLCGQLTSKGAQPACVAACCAEARYYGDLDDPSSDAAKALAACAPEDIQSLKDVGNKPATKYILPPSVATWKHGE
ncbi:MAG: 4Fe-4S dicluster domain-containing protein [Coriobacteriales bacterium]